MKRQLLNLDEQRALIFAIRSRGWNSYAEDSTTLRTLKSLEAKRLIILSPETRQFRVSSHQAKVNPHGRKRGS